MAPNGYSACCFGLGISHQPDQPSLVSASKAAMNITPPTNGQPVVDDAHVGNRRMHVKIRRGLLQGETNVCPAIDDWDVEMLNEDREHLGDD